MIMANPQPTDAHLRVARSINEAIMTHYFTQIPNQLLVAVAISKLTGAEKGIVLLLTRRTLGHHIDKTDLPLDQCARALRIHRVTAHKILKSLTAKAVITRVFGGAGRGYHYQINQNIEEWNHNCLDYKLLVETLTVSQNTNSKPKHYKSVSQNAYSSVSQNAYSPVPNLREGNKVNKEIKVYTDNNLGNIDNSFNRELSVSLSCDNQNKYLKSDEAWPGCSIEKAVEIAAKVAE